MSVHVVDIVQPSDTACEDVMGRKLLIGLDGRIHCVYKNPEGHIMYAYSDDDGATWTNEDIMAGLGYSAAGESMALDSNGVPHVVYWTSASPYAHVEYVYKTGGGSWSSPVIVPIGIYGDRRSGAFQAGEWVETRRLPEGTPQAKAKLKHAFAGILIPYKETIEGTFIVNEWIYGQDSGAKLRYQGEVNAGVESTPAIVIDSNDLVHMVLSRSKVWHLQKDFGPYGAWSYGDYVGLSTPTGYDLAVDVDTNNDLHIVAGSRLAGEHLYTFGSWGGWHGETIVSDGDNAGNFSVALDEAGNVHVAFSQEGVGGSNPTVQNIKYRRCPAGTLNWGPIEHVTDDAVLRRDPTIVVDKNNVIRVIFLGRGYGDNPQNENVVARKKTGASWGSVEVLVDRFEPQHEAVGLHCLFPAIGASRPNYPDGYAFIWNSEAPGTGISRVEYWGEIVPDVPPAPGVPSDLLCEQRTNPTDVVDPNPEFSAIYHGP